MTVFGILGSVLAAAAEFQAPSIPIAFFHQEHPYGMRIGNGYHGLLTQGGKMSITKLHAEYAFPVCHSRMREFGAALQSLILETGCNFTGAFDFIVLVVVVAHAHLELLETGH